MKEKKNIKVEFSEVVLIMSIIMLAIVLLTALLRISDRNKAEIAALEEKVVKLEQQKAENL